MSQGCIGESHGISRELGLSRGSQGHSKYLRVVLGDLRSISGGPKGSQSLRASRECQGRFRESYRRSRGSQGCFIESQGVSRDTWRSQRQFRVSQERFRESQRASGGFRGAQGCSRGSHAEISKTTNSILKRLPKPA